MQTKSLILALAILITKAFSNPAIANIDTVKVTLDLEKVEQDKVRVMVSGFKKSENEIQFRFPKIIPGTYSIADYGRYIEDFSAYTSSGKLLPFYRQDSNTMVVPEGKLLDRISYLVKRHLRFGNKR